MRILSLLILCSLTLSAGAASPTAKASPKAAKAVTSTATVGLQAYVAKIAKAVESGQLKPRFFVDVSDGLKQPEQWQEFKQQADIDAVCKGESCFQQAWIYHDKGQLMLAAFTFSSPSGDWVNNVDYYFYLNGKIAKNRSELRRFGALDPKDRKAPSFLVEVVRSRYYDKSGKVIGADKPLVYRVKDKEKELIEAAEFAEGAWPQFHSAQDLPMAALLKAAKPPKAAKK